MTAIFKKELGSYYNTMYGYIIGAALLLFEGIFIWLFNISGAYTQIHYSLSMLSLALLVAVPVLTMRSFAEERRQKTDLLLYSLPLDSWHIVLGKFMAALTVLLIPMVLILIYPLLFSPFGSINFLSVYSCMLAFILLMAALVAIGMFISSLTESPAICAGVTFAVMLLMYFMDMVAGYVSSSGAASLAAFIAASAFVGAVVWLVTKNPTFAGGVTVILCLASIIGYIFAGESYAGLFPKVIGLMSLFGRFATFREGLFDVGALVYMASVTAVFLFFTVQSLEKRRWS